MPVLARKKRLDLGLLRLVYHALPVSWSGTEVQATYEAEVRRRKAARDEDDWPTLALALALTLPIGTQDRDFSISGVPTYTIGELLTAIQAAERRST